MTAFDAEDMVIVIASWFVSLEALVVVKRDEEMARKTHTQELIVGF